jgi:hypothetical protein
MGNYPCTTSIIDSTYPCHTDPYPYASQIPHPYYTLHTIHLDESLCKVHCPPALGSSIYFPYPFGTPLFLPIFSLLNSTTISRSNSQTRVPLIIAILIQVSRGLFDQLIPGHVLASPYQSIIRLPKDLTALLYIVTTLKVELVL